MHPNEPVSGPIAGLRLPRYAWAVLERENITTVDQLKAVAGEMEQMVHGVGCKTAQIIRAELVRIQFCEKPRHRRRYWARP